MLQYLLLRRNVVKKYKREISDKHLSAKHSIVSTKIEKSVITMLRKIHDKADVSLFKLIKPRHLLMEQQYITMKDNALFKAQKCEAYVRYLEILLYLEKEKLAIAKYQKRWVSDQLQIQLRSIYDVERALTSRDSK